MMITISSRTNVRDADDGRVMRFKSDVAVKTHKSVLSPFHNGRYRENVSYRTNVSDMHLFNQLDKKQNVSVDGCKVRLDDNTLWWKTRPGQVYDLYSDGKLLVKDVTPGQKLSSKWTKLSLHVRGWSGTQSVRSNVKRDYVGSMTQYDVTDGLDINKLLVKVLSFKGLIVNGALYNRADGGECSVNADVKVSFGHGKVVVIKTVNVERVVKCGVTKLGDDYYNCPFVPQKIKREWRRSPNENVNDKYKKVYLAKIYTDIPVRNATHYDRYEIIFSDEEIARIGASIRRQLGI